MLILTIIVLNILTIITAEKCFTIDYKNNVFLRDGKPFRYISGDFEYFKVPSVLWKDRMIKYKAAGLNAIQTCIEWRSHEPEKGVYNFTGDNDLVAFLKLVHQMDFVVIIRPGPFINAERDLGGIPYWLFTVNPHMKVRTSDPTYIAEVDKWFDTLLPKLIPLLYKNGGPIITVQVENEYGFDPSHDLKYMNHLKESLQKHLGNDVVLFTTDHAFVLKNGVLDNVLATVAFGTESDPMIEFSQLKSNNHTGPFVNSEYYQGWFDCWEHPHQTRSKDILAKTLDKILALNASVNIYPFHGGTLFGFGSGSKVNDFQYGTFAPSVTSYDLDAPLDEAGDPTPKYFAVRDVIGKYVKFPDIPLPTIAPKMELSPIRVTPIMSLFAGKFYEKLIPIESEYPMTFEALKLANGFVLYSTIIKNSSEHSMLTVNCLADRALIFVDSKYHGTLSRSHSINDISINLKHGQNLEILVENQGRQGFGDRIPIYDLKGITGNVTLGTEVLTQWKHYLFFKDWEKVVSEIEKDEEKGEKIEYKSKIPTAFSGRFQLPDDPKLPHDTFLKVEGWKKGIAFLNGFNLGRYWPEAGPQMTLYVPAHLFKKYPEQNHISLFELEGTHCTETKERAVQFVKHHELNGRININ